MCWRPGAASCMCSHAVSVSEFTWIWIKWIYRALFSFWHTPFHLGLTFFLPPVLQDSLGWEGKDLMEISYLWLSVSRFPTLCTISGCGSLYFSHLLKEAASLIMAEQGSEWSMSIAECHDQSFYCYIWFCPRFLSYLLSGSSSPRSR